jgi:NAD(P)-dependent dehydrogenase (short-subunit alcohol dehydrogenase family)
VSAVCAAELLRPGLLEGVSVMLAHASPSASAAPDARPAGPACPSDQSLQQALSDSARTSSASLSECELPVQGDSFVERLRDDGPPDLLVVDAASVFAATGERARAALGRTMQLTWEVTRAVAGALIEQQRPGRIVLVAPPEGVDAGSADAADARTHVRATRAGLENLARTTSIEWARYGITTVEIAPGPATSAETVAALCSYLASPAGSYFSGCVLTLDGPEPAAPGDRR